MRRAPVTRTNHTSQQTVYQIRPRHGNEQVREIIPGDYAGTLVADRFSSYEAKELAGVEQHKCPSPMTRNVVQVAESKTGKPKAFRMKINALLQNANALWRRRRQPGPVASYPNGA